MSDFYSIKLETETYIFKAGVLIWGKKKRWSSKRQGYLDDGQRGLNDSVYRVNLFHHRCSATMAGFHFGMFVNCDSESSRVSKEREKERKSATVFCLVWLYLTRWGLTSERFGPILLSKEGFFWQRGAEMGDEKELSDTAGDPNTAKRWPPAPSIGHFQQRNRSWALFGRGIVTLQYYQTEVLYNLFVFIHSFWVIGLLQSQYQGASVKALRLI